MIEQLWISTIILGRVSMELQLGLLQHELVVQHGISALFVSAQTQLCDELRVSHQTLHALVL